MHRPRRLTRAGSCLVWLAALAVASGCGIVDSDRPKVGRVILAGQEGREVRLVLSNRFSVMENAAGEFRITLYQADTIVRALPFDTIVPTGSQSQLLAEATAWGPDIERFQARIQLDGEDAFQSIGPLDGYTRVRFVYLFGRVLEVR